MKFILSTLLCLSMLSCKTKSSFITKNTKIFDAYGLPYYNIPDCPSNYTAETTIARMIDGLGFRYYWATDQLREEDLSFKPSDGARTSEETIDHIYALSVLIYNGLHNLKNEKTDQDIADLPFDLKREKTLVNFKTCSEILQLDKRKLKDMKLIFSNAEYPFWYAINGPIADALWHVGQIVSYRRSSGNPFNSKVSVLQGIIKE